MIRTDIYVHTCKESMWDAGEKLGLSEDVLRKFVYVGYEVKLTIDVDEKTGDAVIVAVDDRKLEVPQC